MADLFSIIELVGSSLAGIDRTKDWIESIRRAPQSVRALSADLRAIERLLGELSTLLQSSDDETRVNASRLVRDAINNCEDVSRQVDRILRRFVNDGSGNISTWKRLAFNFRESDVLYLQREMATCKQTLNMAIGCANLCVLVTLSQISQTNSCHRLATQRLSRRMKRVQRHFGISSSSIAGSDIAARQFERTGQWVLDAEPAVTNDDGEDSDLDDAKAESDGDGHADDLDPLPRASWKPDAEHILTPDRRSPFMADRRSPSVPGPGGPLTADETASSLNNDLFSLAHHLFPQENKAQSEVAASGPTSSSRPISSQVQLLRHVRPPSPGLLIRRNLGLEPT
jgi:hypothetical protein